MNCWIEINSENLLSNYRLFQRLLGEKKAVPVIKSNAYGHGLREVYEVLKRERPAWLSVAYLAEAQDLRDWEFEGRLLLVAPVLEDRFTEACKLRAEILLGDPRLLESWLAAEEKPAIHVKVDTGMSRQGFMPDEVAGVAERLRGHEAHVAGICTHFANPEDDPNCSYSKLQLERLIGAVHAFKQHGLTPLVHASSSTSTLLLEDSRLDLGRIGISLYGFWPSPWTQQVYTQLKHEAVELKPVLSWRTKIVATKEIAAGVPVGYGCTYRAEKDTRIAVLPVGYNEGYPRLAGMHESYVLVRGKRCPLVGRVSMNLMAVDVSGVQDAARGDVVTLIGTDGAETIPAETVADWAETIHYEVVTKLNPSIPRRIV